MALKEERERIAAEKDAAEKAAAAKKAAAEKAARVDLRPNSGSGSTAFSSITNVKLNAMIAEIGAAGPSQLGGRFFSMIGKTTKERDYRKARNIVVVR